ncbi:MAG: hypothetical protein RMI32_08420 [Candidatus Nitrosocaldus sp.]|nr:hypothetical protein [Candidatus Nitrosocaldus sp.]
MNMPRRVAVISKALGGSWINTMNQLNGVQSVEVKLPENIVSIDDIATRRPALIRRGLFDDVEVSINGVFEPSRAMNGLLKGIFKHTMSSVNDVGVRYSHKYTLYAPEDPVRVCQIYVENEGSTISIDQAVVKNIKISIEGTGIATYSLEAIGRYITDVPTTINTDTIRPLYRIEGLTQVSKATISINANHKPVYSINGESKTIGIGMYELTLETESSNSSTFTNSRDNSRLDVVECSLTGDTLGAWHYGLWFKLKDAYAVTSLPVKAGDVISYKTRYLGDLLVFEMHNNNPTAE